MKYIGKGFIVGIPARNLTADEVKKYGKNRLLASGLYQEKRPVKQTVKEAVNGKWN